MADVKYISPDEFKKACMSSGRGHARHNDIYQEMEDMQKNQCIKIDCEEKREAIKICNSVHGKTKRTGDNRFEFFRRDNTVYICKIK